MEHMIIGAACAPLDEFVFCTWIGEATPGERIEYHRGFLALDTERATQLAHPRGALRQLARRAAWASDEGLVHLVQRRIGPGAFSYLAIKRPSRQSLTGHSAAEVAITAPVRGTAA